jgi:hypothetical protein
MLIRAPRSLNYNASARLMESSARFIFTREALRYEDNHSRVPEDVRPLRGRHGQDLSHMPPAWRDIAERLHLSVIVAHEDSKERLVLEKQ